MGFLFNHLFLNDNTNIMKVGFPTEVIMDLVLKNYDAKLDSKKRITIRNPKYDYYHVTEQDNGVVILEPRELVDPLTVSKKTLEDMDKSMENLDKGIVFGPVKIK